MPANEPHVDNATPVVLLALFETFAPGRREATVQTQTSNADISQQKLNSRITVRLVKHFASVWTPPKLSHDPVCWMDRSNNKVADGLCELTMDKQVMG